MLEFTYNIFIMIFFFQENTPACSCVDCESSCPAPKPMPPPPGPFRILGHDGYAVIMLCVFLAGSCLFLFVVFVIPHASSSKFYLVRSPRRFFFPSFNYSTVSNTTRHISYDTRILAPFLSFFIMWWFLHMCFSGYTLAPMPIERYTHRNYTGIAKKNEFYNVCLCISFVSPL